MGCDSPTTFDRVLDVLSDGDWHTETELEEVSYFPREWLRELELSGYSIEHRKDSYFRLHAQQAEPAERLSTGWLAGPDGALLGLAPAFSGWVPRARMDDGPTAAIGGKRLYYPQGSSAARQSDTSSNSRFKRSRR
jgi:hypothetical protein